MFLVGHVGYTKTCTCDKKAPVYAAAMSSSELNQAQYEAVFYRGGPMLV